MCSAGPLLQVDVIHSSAPVSYTHLDVYKRQELGAPDAHVVATGGLARLIADNTGLIDTVDGRLILDGLRIIYQRYKEDHLKR